MHHRLTRLAALCALSAMIVIGFSPSFAAQPKKYIWDFLHNHSTVVNCAKIQRSSRDYPVYECSMPTVDSRKVFSLSYYQEDSEIGSGGICGQVALANTIANLCDTLDYSPHVFDADIQPGKNKGTVSTQLTYALNDKLSTIKCETRKKRKFVANIAKGVKKRIRWASDDGDPLSIAWMVRRFKDQAEGTFNPVIAELRMKGSAGHATTIVAVQEDDSTDSCTVIHNTWGMQFRTPCDKFKRILTDVIFLLAE